MGQKNNTENRFADLLKRIRIDSNLTQREISDRLGMKQAQYSGYELGKNDPTINTVFTILEKLKINKTEFFILLCSTESVDSISRANLLSLLKAST